MVGDEFREIYLYVKAQKKEVESKVDCLNKVLAAYAAIELKMDLIMDRERVRECE